MYATRFTDEYGTAYGVAVPDKYVKFANQANRTPPPATPTVCTRSASTGTACTGAATRTARATVTSPHTRRQRQGRRRRSVEHGRQLLELLHRPAAAAPHQQRRHLAATRGLAGLPHLSARPTRVAGRLLQLLRPSGPDPGATSTCADELLGQAARLQRPVVGRRPVRPAGGQLRGDRPHAAGRPRHGHDARHER